MEQTVYFYVDADGQQIGPSTIEDLRDKGVITPSTLMWSSGMKDWQPANNIVEVRIALLSGSSAVPPPLSSAPNITSQSDKMGEKPHSWLVESVIATLLCFVLSIVGIIYAARVDGLWARGEYDAARSSAKTAKTLFFVSVGVGILIFIFWLIGFFTMATDNFEMLYEFEERFD